MGTKLVITRCPILHLCKAGRSGKAESRFCRVPDYLVHKWLRGIPVSTGLKTSLNEFSPLVPLRNSHLRTSRGAVCKAASVAGERVANGFGLRRCSVDGY